MQSRRRFLQDTAFGALAVWITDRALGPVAAAPAQEGFTFFTLSQAKTIEAMCERMWPATSDDPGAIDEGVVQFIDRALSGFDRALKDTYRRGIESVNAYAREKYHDVFAYLSEDRQDAILTALEADASETRSFFLAPTAAELFDLVLTATRQGLFSDPIHGGNRDFVGWKSIGYPGPRFLYTAEVSHSPSCRCW